MWRQQKKWRNDRWRKAFWLMDWAWLLGILRGLKCIDYHVLYNIGNLNVNVIWSWVDFFWSWGKNSLFITQECEHHCCLHPTQFHKCHLNCLAVIRLNLHSYIAFNKYVIHALLALRFKYFLCLIRAFIIWACYFLYGSVE